MSKPNGKRVLFIHPDLGIGGAERLIVDAAVGLQDRGHSVTIYTSHCDPNHCFDEARNGIPDCCLSISLNSLTRSGRHPKYPRFGKLDRASKYLGPLQYPLRDPSPATPGLVATGLW
jgi:hypothetical protein